MKIVFVGPSLYGAAVDLGGLDVRPPAAQGDLLRAVLEGATVIGLIDGAFEATASVWHKEILFALERGVQVAGGASMGALRAAECAAFGMIAVGEIARRYLAGEADDDALVAVTHGPAELGSPPLSEALVDCEATIGAMRRGGVLDLAEARRAMRAASAMFYKDRTIPALAVRVRPAAADTFEAAYRRHRVGLKTADALEVLSMVKALPDERASRRRDWLMNETPLWREAIERLKAAAPMSDRRT
jgi:hypothetical protein